MTAPLQESASTSAEDSIPRAGRALLARHLGTTFARKATPALCAWVSPARQLFGAESVAAASASRPTGAVVLEIDPGRVQEAWSGAARNALTTAAVRLRGAGVESRVREALGGLRAAGIPVYHVAESLRRAAIASARDSVYRLTGAFTDAIERNVRGVLRPGPEAAASATVPSLPVELCWLNGTMRAWAPLESLVDVVDDPLVASVDVPRRIRADGAVTTPGVVGADGYRSRSGFDGTGIIVAVVDGEVSRRHPALKDRVLHKANYTAEVWGTADEHGTAVAGIIGASSDAFTGVAPGVTIYSYKVLATASALSADDFGGALAIQQALEDGAHVANCSWGVGPAGDGTSREARACDRAWELGLTIVKSAGNGGPDASTMTTPADASGVIVVGGTDVGGMHMQDYSSRGPVNTRPGPHLVAPGGTAGGPGVTSCLVGGGYGDVGYGTSFAAPHVAGLAALMLDADPCLTPDDVRTHLVRCCQALANYTAADMGAGPVSLRNYPDILNAP